jgi:hypothetical protein
MLELDRQPDAEQKREQSERLQVDADHEDRIDGPVDPRRVWLARQEALEDGDPEFRCDVHRQNAEQGEASQDIERQNAIAWRNRTGC